MLLQARLVCSPVGLVEFTLGLISGGGSIMATRLLLYVVELQPHVDIGTGAPNRGEVRFQERRGDLWSSAMGAKLPPFGRRTNPLSREWSCLH